VILLHGYAETSRMWKPIIPLLTERFTVIAPDVPGIGDLAIPANRAAWAYFGSFPQAAKDRPKETTDALMKFL
jgi:pimeloyl-ACP methyl ester carboxylesterase